MSFTFDREPTTYINLAKAIITLAVVYGFPFTESQQNAVITVVTLVVTFVIGGLAQRALTTPVAAPVVKQGTEVTVVTPPGEADQKVTV